MYVFFFLILEWYNLEGKELSQGGGRASSKHVHTGFHSILRQADPKGRWASPSSPYLPTSKSLPFPYAS